MSSSVPGVVDWCCSEASIQLGAWLEGERQDGIDCVWCLSWGGWNGKELAQLLSGRGSWTFYIVFWALRDPNQKLPVLLMARPRTGTASLLLHPVVKASPMASPHSRRELDSS